MENIKNTILKLIYEIPDLYEPNTIVNINTDDIIF